MITLIAEFILGMLSCTIGYLIWITKKVDLIPKYYLTRVKNIKDYCNSIGKTIFFLGIFLVLLTTFCYLGILEILTVQIFVFISVLIDFIILLILQKKFLGRIF